MRKLLICLVTVGLVVSCDVEEVFTESNNIDDKKNFELYTNLDSAMGGFDQISEQASLDVQGASKSSSTSCIQLELLIPYQENQIPGFGEYDYYSKLILDYTGNQCQFDDWKGKLEYYVAGVFDTKWKDSTAFKNIVFDDGHVFNGFRVAKQNTAVSTAVTKVYDILIDGVIRKPDGNEFHYTTTRNFSFENRFTSDEVVIYKGNSSILGISESFTINTTTVEGEPLLFKATCFDRPSFFKYPVAGSQDFSSNFGVNFNVDYGNGTCDKEVVLTNTEGESVTFEM